MVKKQISLIIVTYESLTIIQDCLDSVFKFNDIGEELEIIIVDNGSTDQLSLFGFIENQYGSAVTCLAAPGNVGYGAGNNLGVEHASADRIIIMNPDVRLVEPVFSKLISYFMKHTDTGIVSVSFADESCPFFVKPEHYTAWNLLMFKHSVRTKHFDPKKSHLPGSFLMIDRKVFEQAGQFDEKIFLYFEEADLSNRIEQLGKKIRRIDELKVYHLTHDRKLNQHLIKIEIDSLAYYARKFNFGEKQVLRNYLLVFGLKSWVAKFTMDQAKVTFFNTWTKLLKQKLNEIDN